MKFISRIDKLIYDLKSAFDHNADKGNIDAPEIQDMPCLHDIINKNTIVRPVKANVVTDEHSVTTYIANDRQFIADGLRVIHNSDTTCFYRTNNLKKLRDDADPEKRRVFENILQLYKEGVYAPDYSPRFEFICHIYYEIRYDSDNTFVTVKCDLTLGDMYYPSNPADYYYDDPSELTVNLFEESYAYIPSLYHETTLIPA